MTAWNPEYLLDEVSRLVRQAGSLLAEEFVRPGGPRGAGDKAVVDAEIEDLLRPALLGLRNARFVGEESGFGGDPESSECWLVDPHDGTRAFLQGCRGTAISVALLRDGAPVLGVVHAPLPLDRGADLIAWAEGLPGLRRDGEEVAGHLQDMPLAAGGLVLVRHDSAGRPLTNGKLVAPARFVAMPSIAYRLARVAAGEALLAMSRSAPAGTDYAGGHALLIGAGGVLVDERGRPVRYGRDGSSQVAACFGGAPQAVHELVGRRWRADSEERRRPPRVRLAWPRLPADTALERAAGCLFGQVIGDSLGSLVEFQDAAAIARRHPEGLRDLADGGTWHTLAGQPTDDSELALSLARTLAAADSFDIEEVAAAYGRWMASQPFDVGNTTRQALEPARRAVTGKAEAARRAASAESQANGALMRVAPLGIWAASPAEAAQAAAADAALTHPHPACVNASAAFAAAICAAVAGGGRQDLLAAAAGAAGTAPDGGAVAAALETASSGRFPKDYRTHQGWVLVALGNAFAHLARGDAPEAALVATVGRGGDTDTNAAIAGALLGAAWGQDAFPARWRLPVLACRPLAALGAGQPRPPEYWPDDLPMLAEALLARRLRKRT